MKIVPFLSRMKVLLFVLIRAFEFELAVAPSEIKPRMGVVQRPILRSAPEKGAMLPVVIRPVSGM